MLLPTATCSPPPSAADLPASVPHELEEVFEHAAIGMAVLDSAGRFLRANRSLCHMLGWTVEELRGRHVQDFSPPEEARQEEQRRQRLIAGPVSRYHVERRYVHRSGQLLWGQFTCSLVRDSLRRPAYFIWQAQDITERRLAERDLRDSEARFRSLTMLSSDGYWEQDEQLRFTSVHIGEHMVAPLFTDVTGLARWEIPGLEPLSSSWDEHRRVLLARQPFRDFRCMRPGADGSTVYTSVSGEPVFGSEGRFRGYRGTARDITRRILAEQRLSEARSMLQIAAQIGRLGGWTWDIGAERVAWSPEVCAIHDVRPDYQPTPQESLDFVVPEHRQRFRDALRACSRQGAAFDLEAEVVTARGRRVWVRLICEPHWNEHGEVARINGACQDISESKQASEKARLLAEELNSSLEDRVRRRTAQLEAANKELEAFSYSIAHDLRAPLATIDGFSRMLEGDAGTVTGGPGNRSQHYLRRIRSAVRHMGDLTEGLLVLANLSRGSLRREEVDLAVMARGALDACREREPGRDVQVTIPAALPATGDPSLLAQVLTNLVENAWKFTARVAPAQIEVGNRLERGEAVYFVRDNGAGFDMAHAGKLFEAFQRLHTRAEFEGTGIGLAVVHKIIVRHGGRVWAQAVPGRGACLCFTLPPDPP